MVERHRLQERLGREPRPAREELLQPRRLHADALRRSPPATAGRASSRSGTRSPAARRRSRRRSPGSGRRSARCVRLRMSCDVLRPRRWRRSAAEPPVSCASGCGGAATSCVRRRRKVTMRSAATPSREGDRRASRRSREQLSDETAADRQHRARLGAAILVAGRTADRRRAWRSRKLKTPNARVTAETVAAAHVETFCSGMASPVSAAASATRRPEYIARPSRPRRRSCPPVRGRSCRCPFRRAARSRARPAPPRA